MGLDVSTLAVMTVLVGIEIALGFLLVGRLLGTQPGLRPWVLCAMTMAAGGLVWMARGLLPEVALVLASNGAIFCAMGFAWIGARDFCGVRRTILPIAVGVIPFLGGLAYFTAVVPSTRARVILAAGAASAWLFATAWTFFRRAPEGLGSSARIAAGAFAFHGAFQAARMFFPQEGGLSSDLMRQGWPGVTVALELIVASVAILLALVALVCHRLVRDLGRAARFDVLTGVLNRRALEQEGGRAIQAASAMGLPCSVVIFDLDRFKHVNDTLGHQAGDAALRHVAAVVSSSLRRTDLLGRYGGEEFVVVMPGAGVDDARAAAERFRAKIAGEPAWFGRVRIPVTASVGLAFGDRVDLETLLARADAALYRAKDGGRDRVIEAAA